MTPEQEKEQIEMLKEKSKEMMGLGALAFDELFDFATGYNNAVAAASMKNDITPDGMIHLFIFYRKSKHHRNKEGAN